MSVSYQWIFWIPNLLMIAFCIGAMMFVGSQPSEYQRPKKYVIIALAIMLLSRLVFPFLNVFMVRWFDVSVNAIWAGVFSIAFNLAIMISIVMLIIAAFVDRKPGSQSSSWDPGGTPLADQPSDNPYAAPRR